MYIVLDFGVSPGIVVLTTPDRKEAEDTAETYARNTERRPEAVVVVSVQKVNTANRPPAAKPD